MSYYANAQKMRAAMDSAGAVLTDAQAVECALIYPEWASLIGTTATPGRRFRHDGTLYKVRDDAAEHVFSAEWPPGVNTAALYEAIDATHAGTIDEPIPWAQPMELYAGKYYTEGGKVYRCTRDSGQPLAYNLADLVGLYVEEVTS